MTSTLARCCICATDTERGVSDRQGRFVCEDCLERARKQILARRAREAQQKLDARIEQQLAEAEQDNSLVLELRESLDPALALLCPSCGRLILLDTGGCRACGYGLEDEAKGKKRSLFFRSGARPRRAPPPQLAPDLSWMPEPDPLITRSIPWLVALILLVTFGAGFVSHAMRIASEVLAVCLHATFTLIVLAISTQRGLRNIAALLTPLAISFILFALHQRTSIPVPPWAPLSALAVAIVMHAWYVAHNVRGMLKVLFLITALASVAIIARHLTVTGAW